MLVIRCNCCKREIGDISDRELLSHRIDYSRRPYDHYDSLAIDICDDCFEKINNLFKMMGCDLEKEFNNHEQERNELLLMTNGN